MVEKRTAGGIHFEHAGIRWGGSPPMVNLLAGE